MKELRRPIFLSLFLFAAIAMNSFRWADNDRIFDTEITRIRSLYLEDISALARQVDSLKRTIGSSDRAQTLMQIDRCRQKLKAVEPLLLFFDRYNYHQIFGDPIPEKDPETGDVIPPRGLLVMEELLDTSPTDWKNLEKEVIFILNATQRAVRNANTLEMSEKWLFQSFRIALVKAFSHNVTGVDNTRDDRFRNENSIFFLSLDKYLSIFDPLTGQKARECAMLFEDPRTNFKSFDRTAFYRQHLNPLYRAIQDFCHEKNVAFPDDENYFNVGFNSRSNGFFEADFAKPYFHFPRRAFSVDSNKTKLGKKLFFDPILSGDLTRSCASCHMPSKAFTDGLRSAMSIDGKTPLSRNTPTLINVAFQSAFQLDGNASLPEEQFAQVLFNPHEMGITQDLLIERLNDSREYDSLFRSAFQMKEHYRINDRYVIDAIGYYLRSLTALDSRFDRYMRGEGELTRQEVLGANLFLGKGLCGTCHFVPFFNGLKPPFFEDTENEVIGAPGFNVFEDPAKTWELDEDQGLYFHTNETGDIASFKTPTVRNVSLTAPYMHNGVFGSLEHVIEFYDQGGGIGLGIDVPSQTLPSDKLNLSDVEKQALVSFLHALTDTVISGTNLVDPSNRFRF